VEGVTETAGELARELTATDSVSTSGIARLMRDQEFVVPTEDILDADLYLIERVLGTRYGAGVMLCALAQHLGAAGGWESTICLHEGRFCLLDRQFHLVDPAEGWNITTPEGEDRYHICSRREVLLAILCQLFLGALVDGNLRDIHHFGTLLTGLNHDGLAELPFPIGTAGCPPCRGT
jgi:hypothetical protein